MTANSADRAGGLQLLPVWVALIDLLACLIGFCLALGLYQTLLTGAVPLHWSADWIRETLISAITAWVAIVFTGNPWEDGVRLWIDRLFSTIGFNLMVQYGLDYLFHIEPIPWPVAVAGSIFAIGLVAVFPGRRHLGFPSPSGGTLLLGYDSVAEAIRPALGSVVGVLGAAEGATFRRLGALDRFEDVVASECPSRIVINDPSWPSFVSPRRLLALRYAGVVIEDAPSLFEALLKRVRWDRLPPLDLLLSPRLNINRPAIALQAVYTNVIGLGLLLLCSPVLILVFILLAVTTAASPIETAECIGFQRIPFLLLRFRTLRRNGEPVWSGTLLQALHLVNLPQLINVVRGEMALFGPPPVRRIFAERLEQFIPFYAHRFSVKPGIVGWSQANLAAATPCADESLRLEYDLYYIREESPSLDLDILFRTVFRAPLGQ
jgi:lipopolysaccharide/colanic/teichoic acid biosynthesis glycosyltransferase